MKDDNLARQMSQDFEMTEDQRKRQQELQEEFDKIQRAVAFTRGLKRDGSLMTRASSKKLKTGDVEVDVEAPSHGVPQEVEVEAPSQDVSREKVDAPSHSQNIPEAQVEVPSQEATVEDVEVPSNIASKAQQTASSLKKVGTKKKRLGRKGVHTSQSTIPIEEGDPDAEHKLCIKYASDEDSASDCDTPVHLYAVVDWELLPTGLGSINAIYRLDNSRKYFTSLREILHLVTRADLMTIYGRVMTFYQDKKAEGVGLVLSGDLKILMDSPEVNDGSDFWKNQHTWSIQNWKLYSFSGVHVLETVSGLVIHMFVDKKYPLSINLIERMLDHQLEICHGTVEWLVQEGMALGKDYLKSVNDCDDLIKIIRVAAFGVHGVHFLMLLPRLSHAIIKISDSRSMELKVPAGRYVVPTVRVKVLAGRKIEESLNVTFDETPPPSKTSPLVDDNLDEEEAIREIEKKNLENIVEDETLEIDEIVNIKESRNHPLENVIGNLNQRTLRSQAQNQSNFYYFISTIEPKNVNEALGDESWIVTMQEELNQFISNHIWELVPQPRNMIIIRTK
ncbi:hypothetical protein Tco_0453925 [Tanacetum coccineum]